MIGSAPASTLSPQAQPGLEPADAQIRQMIAEAAYYLAEQRGFEPGHELEDWLQAEAQVFDKLGESAR